MIYIVEDNEGIRETIKAYLELAGFETKEFSGASGVLESLEFKRPTLCIFDVMLPDGNGFTLAKKVRTLSPQTLFLFLTALDSEGDRITGFELGADDYIRKPFSPRELVLRVQAILRRSGKASESPTEVSVRCWELENHLLSIDSSAHRVLLDGREVKLTAVEWNILLWLADNEGLLVTRERILGECLDYSHDGSERTVNTHVKNVRAKLGGLPWIETVRGFGYRFSGVRASVTKGNTTDVRDC